MKKTIYLFSFIFLLTILASCSNAELNSTAEDNLSIAVENFSDDLGTEIELTDVLYVSVRWEHKTGIITQSVFYYIEYLNTETNLTGYVNVQLSGNLDEELSVAFQRTHESKNDLDAAYNDAIHAIEDNKELVSRGANDYYNKITYSTGSIKVETTDNTYSDKQ